MVKKLLSILMVACMVLTLIPNVAKADDQKVVITDIKVTVQTPKVGEKPSKEIISVVTTPETTNSMTLDTFVWWYIDAKDFSDIVSRDKWHMMSDDMTFEEGYYYSPQIQFKLNTGYELSSDVTGSINGYKHSGVVNTIGGTPGYAYLITEFVPTQPIAVVEASVDHPIYGATKDEISVWLDTPTIGAHIENVDWYKVSEENYTGTKYDSWTKLEEDEEFTSGYYYGAYISVKTEGDYYYRKTLTGKVNGQESLTTFGDVRKSATLADLFITFEPFKLIKDVKATVATPKIGEEVDFNASIVTDPENSATVIEGASWIRIAEKDYTGSDEDSWELVEQGEKFEEGYYYMVGVVMEVDDAYYPDDTTTGTINSREHNDMFGDFLIGKINEDYYHNYLFLATLYGPLAPEKENVPSTGDNSPLFLMLSVMALSGAAIAVVDKKRKK